MLECPDCNSKNYVIYNNEVKIISLEGILTLSMPRINLLDYVKKHPYTFYFKCNSCHCVKSIDLKNRKIKTKNEDLFKKTEAEWKEFSKLTIEIPAINFSEIVLDLDETLMTSMRKRDDEDKGDFEIKLSEEEQYICRSRPYVPEFIKYVEKKFKSYKVFTAAKKEYARQALNNLGMVGWQALTRKDLSRGYPLMDRDYDYHKKINNVTFVENCPCLVEGENNIIIGVKSFIGSSDNELKDLIYFFENHRAGTIKI